MANTPSDLFKDLDNLAKRFVKNAQEKINDAKQSTQLDGSPLKNTSNAFEEMKERLRQRKPFGLDVNKLPDSFEARLDRLKRLRDNPATLGQKEDAVAPSPEASPPPATPSVPSEPIAEKKTPAPPSKNVASDQNIQPPQQIVQAMAEMLGEMTGKVSTKQEYTWTDMDKFSAQLRKSWTGLLATKDVEKAQKLLPVWSSLIDEVAQQSSSWGDHAASWSQWAQKCKQECGVLEMWLLPSSSISLNVPSSFEGKGKTPQVPKNANIPSHLIQAIQEVSDFWTFVEKSDKNFYWRNTPQHHAFDQAQKQLEDWSPNNNEALSWKEDALDYYAVLGAKLVLRAENKSFKPSSPKVSSKKNVSPRSSKPLGK